MRPHHRPGSEDTDALSLDRARFRLHVPVSFQGRIFCCTVDKYQFLFERGDFSEDFSRVEMQIVAVDEDVATYECDVVCPGSALMYHFVLESSTEESLAFGNDRTFEPVPRVHPKFLYTYTRPSEDDLFRVPAWAGPAVAYEIFVDSFSGDPGSGLETTEAWKAPPERGQILGGSLAGVESRLDYLQDLGIDTLYLTPIFRSNSNHRYKTIDYLQVDPIVGTNDGFIRLVEEVHRRSMRMVLDVVLHASGTDFFAFRDLQRNGERSRYRSWFFPLGFPVRADPSPNYRAWGNYGGLPKLNLAHPEVQEYLLGALSYWVRTANIDGLRIDTCDEMSHGFLRRLRSHLRSINSDLLFIGEVWHDARPWLDGSQLDGVMNYPLREAIIDFVRDSAFDALEFHKRWGRLRGRYRHRALTSCWSLIESHDTSRCLEDFGGDVEMLRLAITLMLTLPGTPMLYYGTEVGMTFNRGDCRQGMVWESAQQDHELHAAVRRLVRLRRTVTALHGGDLRFLDTPPQLLGFVRRSGDQRIAVFVNPTPSSEVVNLRGPWCDLQSDERGAHTIEVPPKGARILDLPS